jgi:endonuclease G
MKKTISIVIIALVMVAKVFSLDPVPDPLKRWTRLDYPTWSVYFDNETLQPGVTWYTLTKEDALNDPPNDRPSSFRQDPRIKTLKHSDYTNSGYDRGHMVPADDRDDDQEALDSTFYMTNVSPQIPHLNQRGTWRQAEIWVDKLAEESGPIQVFSGPVFMGYPIFHTKDKLIPIPTHFFKIVARGSQVVAAFLIPNSGQNSTNLLDYSISYDPHFFKAVFGFDLK